MRKAILAVAAMAVLAGGFYLAVRHAVTVATSRTVAYVGAEGERFGVKLVDFDYEDAPVLLPGRICWVGVRVEARIDRPALLPSDSRVEAHVERMTLSAESLRGKSFSLRLEGITLNLGGEGEEHGGLRSGKKNLLRGREATVSLRLSSYRPARVVAELREAWQGLADLFLHGRTALPVTFSGIAFYPEGSKYVQSRVEVKPVDGFSVLTMNREDVTYLSREFGLVRPLTRGEVELVAAHPLKARRLLQIRTFARRESRAARGEKSGVSEDAYRHVLWSYLLAKEYGEEFARMVTDTHEEGRTGNTEAERIMDLENNEIGFEYARLGYGEKDLLGVMTRDSRVIHRPGQASARGRRRPP